jgi:competence protein ComEA
MAFRSFRNSLKDYLTFTNRERKPILILIVLILLSMGTLVYLKLMPDNSKTDFSAFEKEIIAFENAQKQDSLIAAAKKNEKAYDGTFAIKTIPERETTVFDFNPNGLADSLWIKLGISEKTIRIIKNYEAKGGKFYKKEDLKKVYGFNEKDYGRLQSYIIIPERKIAEIKNDSVCEKKEVTYHKSVTPPISFDLNTVSSVELKSIYGIGDVKANSIIKYRSMLGGYFSKEQLREAYGIDSALYDSIKSYVDVKTKNFRTININTAYEPELKHPYISKQLAVVLVNYRKMHGNFKSVEEIKKLPLINDELYLKLAHYLSVN